MAKGIFLHLSWALGLVLAQAQADPGQVNALVLNKVNEVIRPQVPAHAQTTEAHEQGSSQVSKSAERVRKRRASVDNTSTTAVRQAGGVGSGSPLSQQGRGILNSPPGVE